MTTTAQAIILEAQTALQDMTGTRWPASELVRYLNDGQRAIVAKRPDQNASTVTFTCVAGAEQLLPVAVMSLIDIPRNTAGRKRALTKVSLPLLDATSRDWRSKAQVSEFLHFCYDQRRPRQFELYPPALADATVQLEVAMYPTDLAEPTAPGKAYSTVTGNIGLADEWGDALLWYVLFRAWSKDAEFGGNAQLASANYQMFKAELGEQLQSTAAVAPKE